MLEIKHKFPFGGSELRFGINEGELGVIRLSGRSRHTLRSCHPCEADMDEGERIWLPAQQAATQGKSSADRGGAGHSRRAGHVRWSTGIFTGAHNLFRKGKTQISSACSEPVRENRHEVRVARRPRRKPCTRTCRRHPAPSDRPMAQKPPCGADQAACRDLTTSIKPSMSINHACCVSR